jgi:hypothetical protein
MPNKIISNMKIRKKTSKEKNVMKTIKRTNGKIKMERYR